MGSNSDGIERHNAGMIPRAARQFFDSIEAIKSKAIKEETSVPSFELSIQFVEVSNINYFSFASNNSHNFQLYNDEIIDLMAKVPQQIKICANTITNEICLDGAISTQVNSAADILKALRRGALNRKTAITNMNKKSSRSHAIFTVIVSQKRFVQKEV